MSMTPTTSDPDKVNAVATVVKAQADLADAQARLQALVPSVAGWYVDINGQPWNFDGTTWTWHQTDSMINYPSGSDVVPHLPLESIEEPLSLMTPTEALDQANTDLASAQAEVAFAESEIVPPDSGDSGS